MVDTVSSNIAASAYGNTQNIGKGKMTAGEDDGVSFSDFLKETATNTIDTMKQGESVSAQAVTGDADITDVVQAVTAAEVTLQTVVAVRDRLVSAYQDIMRMPI